MLDTDTLHVLFNFHNSYKVGNALNYHHFSDEE